MKTSSAGRTSPTSCSRRLTTSALQWLFDSGYWLWSRAAIVVISSCARSIDTPGPRRPKTVRKSARRGRVESVASGTQISTGCASRSASGTIPTTMCGTPLSWIGRPTISRLAPNRRRQYPSPSMATRGAAPRSSSSWNARPTVGGTPKTVNSPGVVMAPATTSGSPCPVRLKRVLAIAPRAWNERAWLRQSRKSGSEAVSRPMVVWRPQTMTRRPGSG